MEMTLRGLGSDSGVDQQDFLARADMLRALGRAVLISNHGPFFRLAEHLTRYTQKAIGIAMGVPAILGIMDEQRHADLPGRALEVTGRLFTHNVRAYLYPYLNPASGELVTAETLRVAPNLQHLYAHLLQNRYVEPIRSYNADYLRIDTDEVLRQIQDGNPAWEHAVPPVVTETIKAHGLFGWRAP